MRDPFKISALFIFLAFLGFAQKNPKIDSLSNHLSQLKQRDTSRAETLIKLATLSKSGTGEIICLRKGKSAYFG